MDDREKRIYGDPLTPRRNARRSGPVNDAPAAATPNQVWTTDDATNAYGPTAALRGSAARDPLAARAVAAQRSWVAWPSASGSAWRAARVAARVGTSCGGRDRTAAPQRDAAAGATPRSRRDRRCPIGGAVLVPARADDRRATPLRRAPSRVGSGRSRCWLRAASRPLPCSPTEQAAIREAARGPQCGVVWPLLAGIGRVESDHGRFAGAVLHPDGVSTPRIVGIPLDGNGTAAIRDTDHGVFDGDTVWDHAVGPDAVHPVDLGRVGRRRQPRRSQGRRTTSSTPPPRRPTTCVPPGATCTPTPGQVAAVRSYNNSDAYIATVLGLERTYAPGRGDGADRARPRRPRPDRPAGDPARRSTRRTPAGHRPAEAARPGFAPGRRLRAGRPRPRRDSRHPARRRPGPRRAPARPGRQPGPVPSCPATPTGTGSSRAARRPRRQGPRPRHLLTRPPTGPAGRAIRRGHPWTAERSPPRWPPRQETSPPAGPRRDRRRNDHVLPFRTLAAIRHRPYRSCRMVFGFDREPGVDVTAVAASMVEASVRVDLPAPGAVAWLDVSADNPDTWTGRLRTGPLGMQIAPIRDGRAPYFFKGARLRGTRCIWSASTVGGTDLYRVARPPCRHRSTPASNPGSYERRTVRSSTRSARSSGVLKVFEPDRRDQRDVHRQLAPVHAQHPATR